MGGEEDHVVVAPQFIEAENFRVEFFRAVEILHRNSEMHEAFRSDHGVSPEDAGVSRPSDSIYSAMRQVGDSGCCEMRPKMRH